MRAGLMRHRLSVERPDISRDESGDEIIGWKRVATVWAMIEPLGGNESDVNNQIVGMANTAITVRWAQGLDDIAPKWRLSHIGSVTGRIYNVVSVAHIMLGQRRMVLSVISGLNEG